jgi:Arc/MetJ family transcription regulator
MRTNVVIDDQLMESALKASGLKSKRAAIEEGLRLLVQMKNQERIKGFLGKLKWTGDLGSHVEPQVPAGEATFLPRFPSSGRG